MDESCQNILQQKLDNEYQKPDGALWIIVASFDLCLLFFCVAKLCKMPTKSAGVSRFNMNNCLRILFLNRIKCFGVTLWSSLALFSATCVICAAILFFDSLQGGSRDLFLSMTAVIVALRFFYYMFLAILFTWAGALMCIDEQHHNCALHHR